MAPASLDVLRWLPLSTSLIVVDDFLTDPSLLRQAAMGMEFPALQGQFPGRNSLRRARLEGLDERISQLTGESLAAVERGLSHAKFRITLAGDKGLGDIHIDHHASWSGILYLSRPEDCEGGTDFFRHLPTGTERAPLNQKELEAMGYQDPQTMADEIINRDGRDRSKWELVMRVPMRYNRLLLLRPWLWHTAGPGFGQSLENGRLVYLLFYHHPDIARQLNEAT